MAAIGRIEEAVMELDDFGHIDDGCLIVCRVGIWIGYDMTFHATAAWSTS